MFGLRYFYSFVARGHLLHRRCRPATTTSSDCLARTITKKKKAVGLVLILLLFSQVVFSVIKYAGYPRPKNVCRIPPNSVARFSARVFCGVFFFFFFFFAGSVDSPYK
jgi:hypothetical protein